MENRLLKRMPVVFMFSGQGSQYYGMGKELYYKNIFFKDQLDRLDKKVADIFGKSVLEEMFGVKAKKNDVFDDPILSSLSIFMIQRASSKLLLDCGVEPDCVIASSLGMVASLVLANSLNEEQAIKLILMQGKLFSTSCRKGNMIAVLENTEIYHSSPWLSRNTEIASINFDANFVISLPNKNLPLVESYLKRNGILFHTMPISRAYHSKWIDDAEAPAIELYKSFDFRKPNLEIVCCSHAQEISDADALVMWKSVRGTLLFEKSLFNLERNGAHKYIDVGPSSTMGTFLKYTLPANSSSIVYEVFSPFVRHGSSLGEIIESCLN